VNDISLSTVVFDGHPIETALEETAALGLRRVEPAYIQGYMDFDERAFTDAAGGTMRKRLSSCGLSAFAVSVHMDLGHPEAAPMLSRRLTFAASIGARIVITNAASQSNLSAMDRCLAAVLPEAERSRVTIALENPGHGAGALVADGRSGAAVVERFRNDWLKLNYDCANVLTYSEGKVRPADDIDAALPVLAHVHFKDVRRTAGGWAYVPIGDGEAALDQLAAKIATAGVPVGLELPLRLTRRAGEAPERNGAPLDLEAIRAAVRLSLDRATTWLGRSPANRMWP
jgi:sugar phosphate isomerase/epimerase